MNIKHGMSNTKFHRTWRGINQRTSDKTFPKYKSYGGRGIKCEWGSFTEFLDDMYESYAQASKKYGEKNISIERRDNNGNYCKENCIWIVNALQAKNRRNNHLVKYKGKNILVGDFEKLLGICRGLVRYHTKRGLEIKEIINYYNKKYDRE